MTDATTMPPSAVTALDGGAILANARALAPLLREEAAASERQRRLTPRTVEALRGAGVFRMSMPRDWGGPELDPWTQVEVIEALAVADGSAAWCAMIGSDGGFFSAALDDAVGRSLFRDLDSVTAGWVMPGGRLRPVDGGYRLSGRWQFGSGCTHADVLIAGAIVEPTQPAEPAEPAGPGADATPPAMRIAVLPAERFEIIDTWDTLGLAGSGSHDYAVEDAFVPADQTFWFSERRRDGPLYGWAGLFMINLLGVPLGIARAALDAAEELLASKVRLPEMRPARDDPRVRASVAQAEALVGSARSYACDVVGDFWATLVAGETPSPRQRAALDGSFHHTARTCRDAVELVADAAGTASLFRALPLERRRRDLATICHHILTQHRLVELVGGFWLEGADMTDPLVEAQVF